MLYKILNQEMLRNNGKTKSEISNWIYSAQKHHPTRFYCLSVVYFLRYSICSFMYGQKGRSCWVLFCSKQKDKVHFSFSILFLLIRKGLGINLVLGKKKSLLWRRKWCLRLLLSWKSPLRRWSDRFKLKDYHHILPIQHHVIIDTLEIFFFNMLYV